MDKSLKVGEDEWREKEHEILSQKMGSLHLKTLRSYMSHLYGFLCQLEIKFQNEQWCTIPNRNKVWMCMKCMEWIIWESVVYFDWGIMMWNCGNCYVICEKRWWNSQTKMQAKLVSKSNHLKNRVLKNFPFQGSYHKLLLKPISNQSP